MMQPEVVTQSFRATVSVTPLQPLGVVTVGLVSIAVAASWRLAEAPDVVLTAAPGALAAALVLGLDDEGFRFIRPVPTTALARLGQRLLVLIPALVASIAVLLVVGRLLFAEIDMPSAGALSALVAAGVSVEVWCARYRPEVAAEVASATVMGWSLSATFLPNLEVLQTGANSWQTHAVVVVVVSVAATAVGLRGRAA